MPRYYVMVTFCARAEIEAARFVEDAVAKFNYPNIIDTQSVEALDADIVDDETTNLQMKAML